MPTIKTDKIEISAKTKGAELTSIKSKDGTEYLWQADPAFWPKHSPLLFPIIGSIPDKSYEFEGKTYPLENHGFIWTKEFKLVEEKSDYIRFEITESEETLAIYPFRFTLSVGYRVKGDTLSVEYLVKNSDSKTIYFSIGAHPGFKVPADESDKKEDYDILFKKKETVKRYFLNKDNLLSGESEMFLDKSDWVSVKKELFDKGAIVLKDHKSRSVSLKSRKSGRFVKLDFKGFPCLGIWSPKGDAPFICIEPWYGVMPLAGSSPDITKKEGIIALEKGKVFSSVYNITVG
ncbi:MAG: aldose 1-epimerase family protein [Spirochaetia bacterium]|jgi:galactose mutarotase-like enzyme|nr:aldose 1-epimerase family protein [Spirochaetia bacterium]